MNDVEIIQPSEDESCCCCNTDNVLLHLWTDTLREPKTHQHCDLCYATEFGSRCRSKFSGYGDAMDVMRHITQIAHILRKKERGGGDGK